MGDEIKMRIMVFKMPRFLSRIIKRLFKINDEK